VIRTDKPGGDSQNVRGGLTKIQRTLETRNRHCRKHAWMPGGWVRRGWKFQHRAL